ncbi:hypothetical protein H5410_047682, partial [Solanum commersonii]
KPIETPRKSPRFDGTSIDDVHAPSFNILSQTPRLKLLKFRRPKIVIPANQKGKKRKGKTLVETPPHSDSNFDSDFVSQTKKINKC